MHSSRANLATCLRDGAEHAPDVTAFEFSADRGRARASMTYEQLHRQACAIARHLSKRGKPGDRVLLVHPPGLEFVSAFFGCLYARQMAVPVPAPHPLQLKRSPARLQGIVRDAQPATVLGSGPAFQYLAENRDAFDCAELERAHFVDNLDSAVQEDREGDWKLDTRAEDVAFLQYTSGSTSMPKGVIVTHANLMANVSMIHRTLLAPLTQPRARGVFWLPLHHDMGLIGGVLTTVYCEGTSTLMSPLEFLKKPLAWLSAISETRAGISGAPDFAYQFAIDRTTEEERAGLDLSDWRVAFSGADRIRPRTLRRFAEAFAVSGFRKESLYAAYGLAEATLLVSAGRIGAAEKVRTPAEDSAAWVPSDREDEEGELPLRVSCGEMAPGVQVAIAHSGALQPDGRVGEIFVQGPNVAQGYWRRQEESARTFGNELPGLSGTFLRTGDAGFVADGELYVTGRIKDLIIVGGQNHHPEDIESSVLDCHESLRGDGCGVFSVEIGDEERVVVAVEINGPERLSGDFRQELETAIRSKVSKVHMLALHDVVVLGRGRLPKTSSGKLQRHLCREQYRAGELRTREPAATGT